MEIGAPSTGSHIFAERLAQHTEPFERPALCPVPRAIAWTWPEHHTCQKRAVNSILQQFPLISGSITIASRVSSNPAGPTLPMHLRGDEAGGFVRAATQSIKRPRIIGASGRACRHER